MYTYIPPSRTPPARLSRSSQSAELSALLHSNFPLADCLTHGSEDTAVLLLICPTLSFSCCILKSEEPHLLSPSLCVSFIFIISCNTTGLWSIIHSIFFWWKLKSREMNKLFTQGHIQLVNTGGFKFKILWSQKHDPLIAVSLPQLWMLTWEPPFLLFFF